MKKPWFWKFRLSYGLQRAFGNGRALSLWRAVQVFLFGLAYVFPVEGWRPVRW